MYSSGATKNLLTSFTTHIVRRLPICFLEVRHLYSDWCSDDVSSKACDWSVRKKITIDQRGVRAEGSDWFV